MPKGVYPRSERTRYFTVTEFAEVARIHFNSVYAWIRNGRIRADRFGKKWRIPDSELYKFITRKD